MILIPEIRALFDQIGSRVAHPVRLSPGHSICVCSANWRKLLA